MPKKEQRPQSQQQGRGAPSPAAPAPAPAPAPAQGRGRGGPAPVPAPAPAPAQGRGRGGPAPAPVPVPAPAPAPAQGRGRGGPAPAPVPVAVPLPQGQGRAAPSPAPAPVPVAAAVARGAPQPRPQSAPAQGRAAPAAPAPVAPAPGRGRAAPLAGPPAGRGAAVAQQPPVGRGRAAAPAGQPPAGRAAAVAQQVEDLSAQMQDIAISAEEEEKKEMKFEDYEPLQHATRPQNPDLASVSAQQVRDEQKFTIDSNYYKLEFNPQQKVYFYDVAFEPEVRSQVKCRALLEQLRAKSAAFRGVFLAFDGRKLLFSNKRLAGTPISARFHLPTAAEAAAFLGSQQRAAAPAEEEEEDMKRPVNITITETATPEVSFGPLKEYLDGAYQDINFPHPRASLQAVDVIMRNYFTRTCQSMGRSFFRPSQDTVTDIGGGACVWAGHFQSVRATQAGLCLLLDTAFIPMFKDMPLIDYVAAAIGKPAAQWVPQDVPRIEKAIRRVKVEITHRGADSFVIRGLSNKSASADTFELEDGTQTDVASYFANRYGAVLKYPRLPCVLLGERRNKYPMEVCRIARLQRYDRVMNSDQRTAMIEATRLEPADRLAAIDAVARQIKADEFLRAFGIRVNADNYLQAPARIMNPPTIKYANKPVQPDVGAGDWSRQVKGTTLAEPSQARNCAAFVFTSEVKVNECQSFFENLTKTCRDKGMALAKPQVQVVNGNDAAKLSALRQAAAMRPPPDIIFIVLPRAKNLIYESLKKLCEVSLGIPTQCINAAKIGEGYVYQSNVALKVNSKLGGTNHLLNTALPLKNKSTMIIGADVYHPPPSSSAPSIVAVVGSYDNNHAKYATEIRWQRGRIEKILDMKSCIEDLLITYNKHNRGLPEQIVVFRDGVGEGFFDLVISHEIGAIKSAATTINANYKPKITFLNIQKRHHSVFFPPNNMADRRGNPKPGTVIDSVVVDPRDLDFFLYSHACLQGTSRGCHDHILFNECQLSLKDIEDLTYQLAYLYQRCPKSVSIPAPVYYAHLAAARAAYYSDEDAASVASGPQEAEIIAGPSAHANLRERLYFN